MSAHIDLHVGGDPHVLLATDDVPSTSVISDAVNMVAPGAADYEELDNKPSIEGYTLVGDKRLNQLGITPDNMGLDKLIEDVTPLSNLDIDSLFE